MNTKLIKIGVTLWVLGSILSLILVVSAYGQVEGCPYGYYIATNNMCYQYSQQQLQQLIQQAPVTTANNSAPPTTNTHTFGSGNCGGLTQVNVSGSIMCAPGQDFKNCVAAAGNDITTQSKCFLGIR
jgi:hypothetical protein